MATKTKIGIEVPKHSPLHQECTLVIDPQHGGHKFPSDPRFPLPALDGHCAASWVHAAHHALHDMRLGGILPPLLETGRFCCPKWDVDAVCAAALLSEIEEAVYIGTGSSQHYLCWEKGSDGMLDQRVELLRKLDTGEGGGQVGDHPELMGLARVAADPTRSLADKIRLARNWLVGNECPELTEEEALARAEIEDGIADAVLTPCGGGIVVIETLTKGLPSRGRGAVKLGLDRGFTTVVQVCEDWPFPGGGTGRKITVTHRGALKQREFLSVFAPAEEWGGPTPQPKSWIVGSPQGLPTQLGWQEVVSALRQVLQQ